MRLIGILEETDPTGRATLEITGGKVSEVPRIAGELDLLPFRVYGELADSKVEGKLELA